MELSWFFEPGYNWYYKPTKERVYKASACQHAFSISELDKLVKRYGNDPNAILVTTYSDNEYTFPITEVDKYMLKVEAGSLVERALLGI